MSVKEFLKQPAVNIAVAGHYTLAKRCAQGKPRTFACRTSRISPFRMMVAVPVVGRVGDPIASLTASMRETFASKLNWLDQKQKDPSIRDGRKQPRIILCHRHVVDRRRGLGGRAAADRNAAGGRSLRRLRRQTSTRWLRDQVRRTADPRRS